MDKKPDDDIEGEASCSICVVLRNGMARIRRYFLNEACAGDEPEMKLMNVEHDASVEIENEWLNLSNHHSNLSFSSALNFDDIIDGIEGIEGLAECPLM